MTAGTAVPSGKSVGAQEFENIHNDLLTSR
jgi:hypothetical protein